MDTTKRYHLEQTSAFSRWLKSLKDLQAKAAIVLRLKQVQAGHLGDVKSVGGDKSTQQRDIARAQQLAKEQTHG